MLSNPRSARRRAAAGVTAAALALSGAVALAAPASGQETDAPTGFARLFGDDRYATAAAIATTTFDSAPDVVLASGATFPDALAGNYLAGLQDAPVLLTEPGMVPASTLQALGDLQTQRVTVLGGEQAVSPQVLQTLTAAGYTAERLNGDTRFETAAQIATDGGADAVGTVGDRGRTAIVTTGLGFVDALAAGPVAYGASLPVLLTPPGELDPDAATALETLDVDHVLLVGGTDVLSPAVQAALEAAGRTTQRLAGDTRAETAVAVAEFATDELGFAQDLVDLARADDFPDALAGGAHSGTRKAPLVLAEDPAPLAPATLGYLSANCRRLSGGAVFGGVSAVTDRSLAEAAAAVDCAPAPVQALFPSNALTLSDNTQLTGRRVALPTDDCPNPVTCGLLERLNQLDGFDLDPRLALTFPYDVDPVQIAPLVVVEELTGGVAQVTGVERVVYDDQTHTLYAHPDQQLKEGTTYRLRVQGRDELSEQSTFTTLSATDGMLDLQQQVAQQPAGSLQVDLTVPATGTVVQYLRDTGAAELEATVVPNAIRDGSLVFGRFTASSWLQPDRTIVQTASEDDGPEPVGTEELPFLLVLPPGQAPAGGWPVAVFGHGFTGSAANVLLAAATNSASGIATISTHVVGHGFGPRSQWRVTSGATVRTIPALGRGVDVDGQPGIGSTDGSSTAPFGAAQAVGSRDALRQTAADLSTLVRAIGPADGLDLRGEDVTYFGQSFGGIYGTLLAGVEPEVTRAGLNVPGGPISEIVRLSPSFRPILRQNLFFAELLNGGNSGFTESMPLAGEPAVTDPAEGALAIQDFIAGTTWLNRPGSPEAFAPLLRADDVLFQVARGDQTVVNPTSHTLIEAGDLFDRTVLYRNDLTPLAGANPHSFLLALGTPFQTAALQGQAQIATFLRTGTTIDPDGDEPVWEVPIEDPALLLTLGFGG